MDQETNEWQAFIRKANQLFRATLHPAASELPTEGRLPSLGGATAWLNSEPLTPAGLRGKVVLISFWTYTCIDWGNLRSPENYLGYERTARFASPGGAVLDSAHVYAAPTRLRLNEWALSGDWTVGGQATLLNTAGGRLLARFHARDLHLVMGPAARATSVRFRVLVDGEPLGAAHGSDVDEHGNGTVSEQRLYQLIRQAQPITDRLFEIAFLDPGVEIYAFTFG